MADLRPQALAGRACSGSSHFSTIRSSYKFWSFSAIHFKHHLVCPPETYLPQRQITSSRGLKSLNRIRATYPRSLQLSLVPVFCRAPRVPPERGSASRLNWRGLTLPTSVQAGAAMVKNDGSVYLISPILVWANVWGSPGSRGHRMAQAAPS